MHRTQKQHINTSSSSSSPPVLLLLFFFFLPPSYTGESSSKRYSLTKAKMAELMTSPIVMNDNTNAKSDSKKKAGGVRTFMTLYMCIMAPSELDPAKSIVGCKSTKELQ